MLGSDFVPVFCRQNSRKQEQSGNWRHGPNLCGARVPVTVERTERQRCEEARTPRGQGGAAPNAKLAALAALTRVGTDGCLVNSRRTRAA
jgi:hypothetical protein